MKICDKCGVANADDAAFCTGCGEVFSAGVSSYTNSNSSYEQPTQSPFVQPVYSQPAQPQMPYSPQYGYINENMLPPEYKPVSVGQYVGYTILFGLPIIGIIMLFVTAFGSDNSIGLRNYAKSVLVFYAIGIVLTIVMLIFSMLLAASMY